MLASLAKNFGPVVEILQRERRLLLQAAVRGDLGVGRTRAERGRRDSEQQPLHLPRAVAGVARNVSPSP